MSFSMTNLRLTHVTAAIAALTSAYLQAQDRAAPEHPELLTFSAATPDPITHALIDPADPTAAFASSVIGGESQGPRPFRFLDCSLPIPPTPHNLSKFRKCMQSSLNKRVADTRKGVERTWQKRVNDAKNAAARTSATLNRQIRTANTRIAALHSELTSFRGAVVANRAWQKQLLGLANPLGNATRIQLPRLLGCVQKQTFARRMNLLSASREFAKDPLGLISTVVQEQSRSASRALPAAISREFRTLTRTGTPPNDQQLAAAAIRVLGAVIGRSGAAHCLFEEVKPQLTAASTRVIGFARTTVATLQAQARQTLTEKLLPWILETAATKLAQVLREAVKERTDAMHASLPRSLREVVLTQDEFEPIARQVLFKRKIRSRFAKAEVELTALLRPNVAPEAAQQHVSALRELTKGTDDYEALYAEISVEVMRKMAHKFFDSKARPNGGYMLAQAIGLLHVGKGTCKNVIEGVCGLIPEAGAAVAAVVWQFADLLWNKGVLVLEDIGRGVLHKAVDALADRTRDMLLGKKTMSQIRSASARLGPLGGLLRRIPHDQLIGAWVGNRMKSELQLIDKHFAMLHRVAAKAVK